MTCAELDFLKTKDPREATVAELAAVRDHVRSRENCYQKAMDSLLDNSVSEEVELQSFLLAEQAVQKLYDYEKFDKEAI